MRWKLWLGLTLSLAACRETVVLDQGPTDGGGGAIDGAPTNCGPAIGFTPLSPKVMVALDRSDGMVEPFGYSTALAVARDALDQYATRYQNAVWFGYLDFPSNMTIGCSSQTCCGSFSPPNRSLQGFKDVLHACDRNQSCGFAVGAVRPTSAALSSCEFIFNQTEMVQRYILLITNGRPDCGAGPGPGSCGDGGETQNVISGLYGRDVRTHVVSPGPTSADQCLHDLAVAGGTQSNHSPQDPAELTNDIGEVLHSIATDACELDLQGDQIRDSNRVAIYWKGMIIPHDRNTGWEVSSSGFSIFLHGNWCDQFIDSGKTTDLALYTNCPLPPRP